MNKHKNMMSGTGGVTHPFPEKLMKILETADPVIIGWKSHGRCFRVNDVSLFVESIMKEQFTHTKFTSFQRQLNLYGFKRFSRGQDKNSYFHQVTQ